MVSTWLLQQTSLHVDVLPAVRQARWQLLALSRVVRARWGQVKQFHLGCSFYCFQGERDGRDRCLVLNDEASALAQLVLPFFLVTSYWHYTNEAGFQQLLQVLHVSESYIGDVGLASMVFALERMDTSQVTRLCFAEAGITRVGATGLVRLIKTALPALTYVDVSGNNLSANAKGALTRACRARGKLTQPHTPVSLKY